MAQPYVQRDKSVKACRPWILRSCTFRHPVEDSFRQLGRTVGVMPGYPIETTSQTVQDGTACFRLAPILQESPHLLQCGFIQARYVPCDLEPHLRRRVATKT